MLLYKFRSLQNPEYTLDILLNQRLYCSRYSDLNDPFEGLFFATIPHPRRHQFPFPIAKPGPIPKSVDDLFSSSKDRTRICSLSSSLSDVRLWSHYADGHKGIALEIDFSGLDNSLYKVEYSEALPTYRYSILTEPLPRELLTRKTLHWEYEAEHRIIHEEEYFDIRDRVKTIYLGSRISDLHVKMLEKVKPSDTPLIRTEVDLRKVEVRKVRNR